MTTLSPTFRRPWYFSIPLLGWIARDLIHGDQENIYYFLAIVLTLLVLAVRLWGLVALGLTALACVPVMFTILLLITIGK